MYTTSLFLFHRDLRIADNTGLYRALSESQVVIPAFIFDTRQIQKNSYKGVHSLGYLLRAVAELQEAITDRDGVCAIGHGLTHEVLAEWIDEGRIDAVYANYDYTPFAQHRDAQIEQMCRQKGIPFIQTHDALLAPPGAVLKADGTPYTIYTPFFRAASRLSVATPVYKKTFHFAPKLLSSGETVASVTKHVGVNMPPSTQTLRAEALSVLKQMTHFSAYSQRRDVPADDDGTTHLSVHHKFGTISIRETHAAVCQSLGVDHALIRELYWRDFFTHIAYHFPRVFGSSFHAQYDLLKWGDDPALFRAWCEGKTGFPIVDAGMRQLNETGYMHNRVRMIVASFLTKDLRIDWRLGEKYFAQKLSDYDPAVNNGSWQWAASTGCDAQPYFRIFNPWTQQKTYDPDCEYIKRWVPELRQCSVKEIHEYGANHIVVPRYPKPIVDHDKERKKTLDWFSTITQKNIST